MKTLNTIETQVVSGGNADSAFDIIGILTGSSVVRNCYVRYVGFNYSKIENQSVAAFFIVMEPFVINTFGAYLGYQVAQKLKPYCGVESE